MTSFCSEFKDVFGVATATEEGSERGVTIGASDPIDDGSDRRKASENGEQIAALTSEIRSRLRELIKSASFLVSPCNEVTKFKYDADMIEQIAAIRSADSLLTRTIDLVRDVRESVRSVLAQYAFEHTWNGLNVCPVAMLFRPVTSLAPVCMVNSTGICIRCGSRYVFQP
jgi:hypothetical protein